MLKKVIATFLILILLLTGVFWSSKKANTSMETVTSTEERLVEYVDNNPEDTAAQKALGLQYLAKKEYDRAESILEGLYQKDKSNTELLHPLVMTKLYLRQYDVAIELSYELLKFNNYNEVALFNLAQLFYLTNDTTSFLEYLDLSIDAYEFSNNESSDFDSFYQDIETFKTQYKKLIKNNNIEKASLLVLENDLFNRQVKSKAIEIMDNKVKSEINPDYLATKFLLESASGYEIEANNTLDDLIIRYPNYTYASYLKADVAYKENHELETKLMNNNPMSDTNFKKFYNVIFSKNKKFSDKDLEELESIYKNENGRVKQLLSYYLMIISNELKDKENETYYSKIFYEGNFDVYYLLATP